MNQKEFCRPDPEELLRQIQAQEDQEARGRLKVFLGYAPRVGKSERMFDEGRRRLKRGQDVVVGAIQTKGSAELERMICEFDVIPSLRVEGAETVNVDAILERHPEVCLIDELARDNPPGARFNHRWQDVEELLANGINVVGAINLQHVCEEQDAVERITGRRSSHAVPASFIHSADELTIVDVAPEELTPERGASSSLTPDQLNQLREQALLLAAQVVEEQLQRYMDAHGIHQSWGTQERILVCITPRSSARAMLESGARATERFHGHMLALSVKQGELSREAEEALQDNLEYARKLGAEVHIVDSKDPIAAILDFAREQRISQVFIGHTQRPPWKFWERNPVDRLIQAAEGMDVRLFPHRTAA
jgi:two-component system sensor histidine kinase KdpD